MKDRITIHKYSSGFRNEWQDFLKTTNNGTMFHSLDFLDYHDAGKFEFEHLMIRKNDKLIGILPGGIKLEEQAFWSPTGASYGSIATPDIDFSTSLEIVDTLLEYFKFNGFKDIYLIPPPLIYYQNYSQNLEYAMLYRKFDFELHYISHSIHLKRGNDFLRFFDKTARKSVRKILKENKISISESKDYDTFHKILTENKARHNVKPTHSLEDLKRLEKLCPQNLKLLMVYNQEEAIAGSLLFLCNSKVVLCFYNMLRYEYEHLKPIYLIMYETIRWAMENGYEWVDIGVSQDTSAEDPMTPSLNLINFKERFDSRGILRSTYHFKF